MEIKIELNQEQRWGVQFVIQNANEAIAKQNETLPEGEEPKPLWTVESYMKHVVGVATDDYYKQLLKYKEDKALEMFKGLSDAEKAALVAQLNIPPVLQGE